MLSKFVTPLTDFSRKLKNLRLLHGLTQQKLAQKMYMDRSAISHLESGKRSAPSEKVLERIVKALDLTSRDEFDLRTAASHSSYHLKLNQSTSAERLRVVNSLVNRVDTLSDKDLKLIELILESGLAQDKATTSSMQKRGQP